MVGLMNFQVSLTKRFHVGIYLGKQSLVIKYEEAGLKWKRRSVVDVWKSSACKEQYCIGTWNARFMNQGQLDVVKQEVARVHVNILGISEH